MAAIQCLGGRAAQILSGKIAAACLLLQYGEVAEWLNAPVLKTGIEAIRS
jgi:hypothetical protein